MNANIDAVQIPFTHDRVEIMNRNTSVDKQLSNLNLKPVSIVGDDNCFFQSVSVCMFGDQSHYQSFVKM